MHRTSHDAEALQALCDDLTRLVREREALLVRANSEVGDEIKQEIVENELDQRLTMIKLLGDFPGPA
jgi:hypothetical protein